MVCTCNQYKKCLSIRQPANRYTNTLTLCCYMVTCLRSADRKFKACVIVSVHTRRLLRGAPRAWPQAGSAIPRMTEMDFPSLQLQRHCATCHRRAGGMRFHARFASMTLTLTLTDDVDIRSHKLDLEILRTRTRIPKINFLGQLAFSCYSIVSRRAHGCNRTHHHAAFSPGISPGARCTTVEDLRYHTRQNLTFLFSSQWI